MTSSQTNGRTWDKMTDGEKIAFLAVKVMGWIKGKDNDNIELDAKWWYADGTDCTPYYWKQLTWGDCEPDCDEWQRDNPHEKECFWNPLTDWNHWRQVEEKIMGDSELSHVFIRLIVNEEKQAWGNVRIYAKTDLPTRALALYLSYSQLHDE